MTIRQILNQIIELSTTAREYLQKGAKRAAVELYNLIYFYELQLEREVRL